MKKNNNKSKYKKSITIITLIIATIGITSAIYIFNNNTNNNNNDSSYTAKRTSSDEDNSNNTDNTNSNNNETNKSEETPPKTPKETEISSFNTKIYSTDSARQNNINITCSKLNNFIVKKGETFSFCTTVGQATSSQGYQKADIFDKNGNKKKGLGGRKLSD